MAIVTFFPSSKRVEVASDTTLFTAAKQAGLPVASSCDENFVCGKCHMIVLKGAENLSPQTEQELNLLRREKMPVAHRISCQARLQGDCTVTTFYW